MPAKSASWLYQRPSRRKISRPNVGQRLFGENRVQLADKFPKLTELDEMSQVGHLHPTRPRRQPRCSGRRLHRLRETGAAAERRQRNSARRSTSSSKSTLATKSQERCPADSPEIDADPWPSASMAASHIRGLMTVPPLTILRVPSHFQASRAPRSSCRPPAAVGQFDVLSMGMSRLRGRHREVRPVCASVQPSSTRAKR